MCEPLKVTWVVSAEDLGCLNRSTWKRSYHHIKITLSISILMGLKNIIHSTLSVLKSYSRGSDSTAGLSPVEKKVEICNYTCRIIPWVSIQIVIITLHVWKELHYYYDCSPHPVENGIEIVLLFILLKTNICFIIIVMPLGILRSCQLTYSFTGDY